MARRPRGSGWGVQAWLSFSTSVERTGNWNKTGTTVVLTTPVAHNLSQGFGVHVLFSGVGAPTNGYFIVTSVLSPTQFSITTATGTNGASGTFSNRLVVMDGFNISSALRISTGTVQVSFERPFANPYYSVCSTPVARIPGAVTSSHTMMILTDVPTPTSVTLRNVTSANAEVDLAYTSVQFCGRQ